MIDKYMIDSSVWINYFRDKNYEFTPFIKELMEKDQVYINGIIQIELLKGAKSEKNYRSLKNSLNGLHFLEIDKGLFDSISEAAFKLRTNGVTVPLTDLIIAVQCVENGLILIEEDRHFEFIRDHFELKLYQHQPVSGEAQEEEEAISQEK
jgi:predicted nucleic acid-binding protein